ncbi:MULTISPECIES: hypothetical protein [unclassified Nocardia]|uniref:hypothetical protein n=1 Tax=unclassified Nocardia TaxID=2637762 RepID=UPI00278BC446|nr:MULTISPECIES: hypothetical protein [unclassified Nocardia]
MTTTHGNDGDWAGEDAELLLDEPDHISADLRRWLAVHTTSTLEADTDRPSRPAPAPRRSPWRAVMVGIGVLGLVVTGADVVIGRDGAPASSGGPTATVPASARRVVSGNAPGCATTTPRGDLAAAVAGPDRLRATDGAHAITVFEAAYYLARSGERARQLVAASASIPEPAAIQAGIDSLPAGTTYCATITTLAAGLHEVEIREAHPGGVERLWRQQISTTTAAEGAVITAIAHL